MYNSAKRAGLAGAATVLNLPRDCAGAEMTPAACVMASSANRASLDLNDCSWPTQSGMGGHLQSIPVGILLSNLFLSENKFRFWFSRMRRVLKVT